MTSLAMRPTLSLIGDPEADELRTGAWLRGTAVLGALGTGAVVVAGALHLTFLHVALVPVAIAPLVAVALASRLAHPRLRTAAAVALLAVLAEAATASVLRGDRPGWAVALHLVVGGLAFAATVVSAGAAFRGEAAPLGGTWRDYLALTKPRVMVLLLLTAVCAMFVAASGLPRLALIGYVLAGGALASGGAAAMNHVMDRDVDRKMRRTSSRPVASTRVSPSAALEFGLAISAFSFVLLASTVNVLAAVLALAGNVFYVIVYTGWLKRSTPQNIVIGGAAGAMPPLVGWAAVTGRLSVMAAVLFLIVFFWTPPHFWALAILIREDYRSAGIPMLPVVRGVRRATVEILGYTVVLLGISMLPFALGAVGLGYLVPALLLGGTFIGLAWLLLRRPDPRHEKLLFHYSLAYLAALFVAMAAAAALG